MRRRFTPREGGGLRLAALAVVLAALAPGADVAGAHTKLVRTAASDHAITLTFSTSVSPHLTRIDVLAELGGDLEPGELRNAPRDPRTVAVPMLRELPAGRYFVTWSTANDDGHVVNGAFDFSVRDGGVAGATRYRASPAAPAAASGALSLARIAHDAAMTLAFGLVVFLQVVWRRLSVAGVRSPSEHVAPTEPVDAAVAARLRALLVAAAAVGAVSACAAVALQGAVLAGGAPWDSAAVAALPDVLASRAGASWAIAALLWIAAIAAARWRHDGWLVAGLAGLLVISAPLRGHGGTGPLGLAIVVHVAAAGAWVGGLVALLAAARAVRGLTSLRDRMALLATVFSRFAAIALPCAVAVLATGILQAVASLDGPDQLVTASYGRLVTAKLALFATIVALGAGARRVLVGRLWKADGARAAVALRKTIAIEVVLAMGAITAAGSMASTGPPA